MEGEEERKKRPAWMSAMQSVAVAVVGAVGTAAAVLTCYHSDRCYIGKNTTRRSVQKEYNIVQEIPVVTAAKEDVLTPSDTALLELVSLKCNKRHERRRHAPDEPYLIVMNDTVTKPFKMDEGHMVSLEHLGPYRFIGSAEIELWDSDKDDGNADEYLGNTFARESEHAKGEIAYEFTGSGAHYVLTYRVRKRSGG